ncbi:MAG: hypothetical protein M3O82_06230 [Verrucomicrobiota bacterium]|nr:hypothetical protein [Verrucomicrobiota bacterium]
MTVKFNIVLWERLPLVASNPIGRDPGGVDGGMNIKTCALPEANSTNGDAGDDIAPGGNPLIATFTVPLKPFCRTIEINTGGLIVPTVIESANALVDRLKSGCADGRDEPPPQP